MDTPLNVCIDDDVSMNLSQPVVSFAHKQAHNNYFCTVQMISDSSSADTALSLSSHFVCVDDVEQMIMGSGECTVVTT